ncbi:type IV conjugative transfer system protein TraL, partial [Pantoea agglomerans]|nr:type IV conjugative transfer system protein TraL [Pantoea agglomerans]
PIKKVQKPPGPLPLLYWYLPTTLFRTQLRRVPDSGNRHWMQ